MSIDTTGLTAEAHQLIARDELGAHQEIYRPPTVSNIMGGVFMLACAAFIGWIYFVTISNSPLGRHTSIVIISFSLVILFLIILGIRNIFSAIANRNKRIVLCTHGVASLQSSSSDSFHWQDVLTTTRSPIGGRSSNKNHIIYTVHCYDDRKFVFRDLVGLYNLAESIDVNVARAKQSQGHL